MTWPGACTPFPRPVENRGKHDFHNRYRAAPESPPYRGLRLSFHRWISSNSLSPLRPGIPSSVAALSRSSPVISREESHHPRKKFRRQTFSADGTPVSIIRGTGSNHHLLRSTSVMINALCKGRAGETGTRTKIVLARVLSEENGGTGVVSGRDASV